MSLAEACWWTLARTIVICLVSWPVVVGIERVMRQTSDTRRPLLLALLLAPSLFPELLVGYAYRNTALATPKLAELICGGLLLIRVIPVGVVALLVSPAALTSASAIYSRWLLVRAKPRILRGWWQLALCYWHGPVLRALPAMSLLGLVAYQEFELAALLQTTSWTDWLITAQRLGLSTHELLMQSLGPILMQLPILIGIVFWFTTNRTSRIGQHDDSSVPIPTWVRNGVAAYGVIALLFGCLIPFMMVTWQLPVGFVGLFRQPAQLQELFHETVIATAVSLCSGLTAWFIAGVQKNPSPAGTIRSLVRQAVMIPGLAGSLLLGLIAVEVFQQSAVLYPLYDSPLPWIIALIIWLLPRATLLHLWLGTLNSTEPVHLAEMLAQSKSLISNESHSHARPGEQQIPGAQSARVRASNLIFRLRDQPRLIGMGLLCYWAYLDLSTAYLLAPIGMPSGLVRLYNFMHFGRSALLSAESPIFFASPFVFAWLTFHVVRFIRSGRE